MSVAFNVEGNASAVSPTEPDSDCCVFVLDVGARRLTLNRPQTEANTVQGERAEEPVACWVTRAGETRGLDHGNLSHFMDVKPEFGVTILLSVHYLFLQGTLMQLLFCPVIESHIRDERVGDM